MVRFLMCQQLILTCILLSITFYLSLRIYNLVPTQTSADHKVQSVQFDSRHDAKRVLVTGGAGFIGYHLCKTLASDPSNLVIALDNFNDYYDVQLKIDRAYELSALGVVVLNDDVCNAALLRELFARYNLTHVTHLGAQAGVRYSLLNPLAYVRSNVECQVTLFDVITEFPGVKLVYASSSSVYGKTSQVPFSLSANTDRPGNMYAATKKTDELLSHHYCLVHNMSSVGLRFFTVYGPWGRPDMAVYKFAESILDGRDVPMYHVDEAPEGLGRDFTYIDDIVSGVISAMLYRPRECGERFNLGFGNPVSLPNMIDILQAQLGVTATINKLPLPPTEILTTWADISLSTQVLGFRPQTNLTQGIEKFVVWYRGYRKLRRDQETLGLPSKTQEWFERLESERDERRKRYAAEEIQQHNERVLNRLTAERHKYMEWAQSQGIAVPQMEKGAFTLYKGWDSTGGDIMRISGLNNNIPALTEKCRDIEECIAFNSEGVFKSRILRRDKWNTVPFFTQDHQGLYVADVDLCKADLHDCSKYASCTPILPAQFSCKCKAGYYGDGRLCLPRYGEVEPEELQWEYAAEAFSIHNVSTMKLGANMVFFQGLDSPGGDYLVADKHAADVNKLQQICAQDTLCIAVNTNGLMKRRVVSKDKWTRWTNNPKHGIYVFDIDYCILSAEACPDRAACVRLGPADYRCQCPQSYNLQNGQCVPTTTVSAHKTASKSTTASKSNKNQAADGKSVDSVQLSENKQTKKVKKEDEHLSEKQKDEKEEEKKTEGQKEEREDGNDASTKKEGVEEGKAEGEKNEGKQDRKIDGQEEVEQIVASLKEQGHKEERQEEDSQKKHGQRVESQEVEDHFKEDEKDEGPVKDGLEENGQEKEVYGEGQAHIILSVDGKEYTVVPVLINSIAEHVSGPVTIHVVTCDMDQRQMTSLLDCYSFKNSVKVSVVEFPVALLDKDYEAYMTRQSTGVFSYLSSCANYARFFFHRLFPAVHRAVYMDTDTIVQKDFIQLWNYTSTHKTTISAVPRNNVLYKNFFDNRVADIYKKRNGHDLDLKSITFNAGVYHVNLDLWRSEATSLEAHLKFWMSQVEHGLWSMGSQAPMLLMFYRHWEKLPTEWNVDGLGYRVDMPSSLLDGAALLHWTGKGKPWKYKKRQYVDYWERWRPVECGGRGACHPVEHTSPSKWTQWSCTTQV